MTISDDTLRQLKALNKWLGDVFEEGTRLSSLLVESGLDEAEIEAIKSEHLESFLQSVVDLIVNDTDNLDGERRNSVMVRHYGLQNGRPETLRSIGDSLDISGSRVGQLVKKRVQLHRSVKRRTQFKEGAVSAAKSLLNQSKVKEEGA